jgi:type IV pilus assembly protein PilV
MRRFAMIGRPKATRVVRLRSVIGGSRPSDRATPTRAQAGFGLVEAMVTLVVLSIGMIGIASLHGQGLGAGRTALYRTQAVNLAAEMADRIRVNRLGGADFGGAPANNDCGAAVCTPAEMAAHEVFLWAADVAATLPNGAGAVRFSAGTPPTFTIGVTWSDVGIPAITHTIAVQVPDF